MADPCPKCGHIHTSTDAYAVGRFDPTSEAEGDHVILNVSMAGFPSDMTEDVMELLR